MKKSLVSRVEFFRTAIALTLAIALIGSGAVVLPSLVSVAEAELPPVKGPQLEAETMSAIESVRERAGMLSEPVRERVSAASIDRPKTRPSAAGVLRATAHEAIKMKKGILPLIPAKFKRAEEGVTIPVSLTQYCVQGETRRGRQTRHGILAADPRIFPLARYVDVFLGEEYLGRYLVDDTGGNVLGATLDIWNPNCGEARRFGRHWGSAVLVAREVEQLPIASTPLRWDGLAER